MKVLIIEPTGDDFVVDVADLRLEWLQQTVGGLIECVYGAGWHLYCNEEGKLLGLPVNLRATMLVRHLLGRPVNDILVGNVVFLGNGDAGKEADVPDYIVQLLKVKEARKVN